jgi:cell wall-associated NlpC family hydrolase
MRHVTTRLIALLALALVCTVSASQAASGPRPLAASPSGTSPAATVFTSLVRLGPKAQPQATRPKTVEKPTIGERAARLVRRFLGTRYVWGGASPRQGFDCSGLVMYVYSKLGVSLPHHATTQFGYGRPVPYSRLRAGDLVFFSGLGHVGLYVGAGRFVEAPRSGLTVRVQPLAQRRSSYVGARRIV